MTVLEQRLATDRAHKHPGPRCRDAVRTDADRPSGHVDEGAGDRQNEYRFTSNVRRVRPGSDARRRDAAEDAAVLERSGACLAREVSSERDGRAEARALGDALDW